MTQFAEVPLTQVQEFWDARPCNSRHSQATDDATYFDEVRKRRYTVESHILKFADFESWSGKRVFDAGVGIGTDTTSFALAGALVTGVDLSPTSLGIAQRQVSRYHCGHRVILKQASLEDLRSEQDNFDLVWSFGVVHHTPHPEVALQQLRKRLRPGGRLKMMVYSRYSTKRLYFAMRDPRLLWSDQRMATYSEAQQGCPVTYLLSRRRWRQMLTDAGFSHIRMHTDHIFPYSIPAYKQGRLEKWGPYKWMPQWAFHALERTLGWHTLIDAVVL